MKKAIALTLVFIMAVLFASCKKDEEPGLTTTETLPIATQASNQPTQTPVSQTEAEQQTGVTMVLTTNYGETMPTVVTTAFNPANETTQATVPVSFEIPNMTTPDVYTATVPSTTKPTTTTTQPPHTEPTEPKTEKGDTSDSAGKTRKSLEMTSFGFSASKNVTIEFEANGWNGGVKSGKFNASVKTDNGKTSSVMGRVVGIQNSDGYFSVVIPVGDIVDEEVSHVTISIPAGSVTSRNGDQSSKSYTATVATN